MKRPFPRPLSVAMTGGALVLLAWAAAPPRGTPHGGRAPFTVEMGDDADAQAEMEFRMLRDPRTNTIPRGIHLRELALARTLPRMGPRSFASPAGPASSQTTLAWTERGPNNVGGRTRAFAIDVSNPSVLVAGGVAGGMWKSSDDGASWSLKTAPART